MYLAGDTSVGEKQRLDLARLQFYTSLTALVMQESAGVPRAPVPHAPHAVVLSGADLPFDARSSGVPGKLVKTKGRSLKALREMPYGS